MKTWHNVYSDVGETERINTAVQAQEFTVHDGTWLRVQERWNGHRLCTPVGMQAHQASHRWIPDPLVLL